MKFNRALILRLAFILLMFGGTALRMAVLSSAYPVPGDGAHFVQHGVRVAHEGWAGFSSYWSQGMTAMAAFAVTQDLNPAGFLQYVSFAAGLAVVLWCGLIAYIVCASRLAGAIAASVVMFNPYMIHYSTTGYSEMPFLAFCLCALFFILLTLRSPGSKTLCFWHALAGIAMGLGAYFKGLDATLWMLVISGIIWAYFFFTRSKRLLAGVMIFCMAFILVSLPLILFTHASTGSYMPGSKGAWNMGIGPSYNDSKVVYSLDQELYREREQQIKQQGMLSFILKNSTEMVIRMAGNIFKGIRLLSDQLFSGGLRVGTWWFVFLVISLALYMFTLKPPLLVYVPVVIATAHFLALCVVLIHNRLVISITCFGLVIIACIGAMSWKRVREVDAKFPVVLLILLLLTYLSGSADKSREASRLESTWWRYANMQKAAERFRRHGGEDDIIMANGPHLAIHYFRTSMSNTVEMPYASIPEVSEYAEKKRITHVIISDKVRAHWPITRLVEDEPTPVGWSEIDRIQFPGDDSIGIPPETYVYFRITQGD